MSFTTTSLSDAWQARMQAIAHQGRDIRYMERLLGPLLGGESLHTVVSECAAEMVRSASHPGRRNMRQRILLLLAGAVELPLARLGYDLGATIIALWGPHREEIQRCISLADWPRDVLEYLLIYRIELDELAWHDAQDYSEYLTW